MTVMEEISDFIKDKNKDDCAHLLSLVLQGVYKNEFNKFRAQDGTLYEMQVDVLETKE